VAGRYRVQLSFKAQRQLDALPKQDKKRIDARLLALGDNPRPHGVKKLQGKQGRYRIRVGNYRAIYSIHDAVLLVLVLEIVNRRDVYR